jgi:hypothetical protein
MIAVMKIIFGLMIGAGIILVLGAAGSDCDGACMENALPMKDLLLYSFLGLLLMGVGAFGLNKTGDM